MLWRDDQAECCRDALVIINVGKICQMYSRCFDKIDLRTRGCGRIRRMIGQLADKHTYHGELWRIDGREERLFSINDRLLTYDKGNEGNFA